ncbi:unnamed protein product [Mycena citricolor]|uniref:Protein kinase domain-containing protein n=1 Tax=Mycena citricolor TaxID=2018698 RepID=A0AAD2JX45_9AGAR|nr:unnamed protein product [Mycena citricolor]
MTRPARCYPHAPFPLHLTDWDSLDVDGDPYLVDAPWRYFEPFLRLRGYALCWRYYSRDCPETPFLGRSFYYPPAADPFRPRDGEAFVQLVDVQSEDAYQRCGVHQTTGWLTPCPTLKMAYDTQSRVCAVKALHNVRNRAEIDIITFLNSPKVRALPENHTIPVLDKIVTDDWTFIVMPHWSRPVQTSILWEVEDYFNRLIQALEGLAFLHRHGIIHRDISVGNLLLNIHCGNPGVYSCFVRRRIALAYIDFGCAVRFPAGSDPDTWMGTGHWGTMDHAAPEVPRANEPDAGRPYHLAPVDVYAVGSVFLRAHSWEESYCSTFGNPQGRETAAHQVLSTFVPGYLALLNKLTARDPSHRPTAIAALREARAIRDALPLELRFAPNGYPSIEHMNGYQRPCGAKLHR